jgi:hypothetical protein
VAENEDNIQTVYSITLKRVTSEHSSIVIYVGGKRINMAGIDALSVYFYEVLTP